MSNTKYEEELAQLASVAYKNYGKVADFKNFKGDPLPEWENLTQKTQEAWKGVVLSLSKEFQYNI